MKNKKQIGKALGRLPSGLFIVTARYEDKEDAVLASWVNQCSFEPPAVTIMLATLRPARLLVEASNAFTLNILGKDSKDLLKHFFKAPEPGVSIFKGLKVSSGHHGIKILDDAVACLECEVAEQVPVGDHVLYIGEIVNGKILAGGEPYTHVRDNGFNY
ncbi:MAG: flavin reductase [Nitrospina sp.]|nr:MAG: flavin reductase [Nitrospina sp.]